MATKTFLKNKIVSPVVNFLLQGITPEKLALAISLGFLIGIFPVLGTHASLTVLAIFVFRLNPGSVFLISNIVFPFYFVTIIPFLRLGEMIFQVQPLPLSIPAVYELVKSSPLKAIEYLGISILHAVTGWLIVAIPLSFIIYYIFVALLRQLNTRLVLSKKHKTDHLTN